MSKPMPVPMPEIRSVDGVPTLFVDGAPFLFLGGELHNSSCSSPDYLRDVVWPALRGRHLNGIVGTVSWEQVEPEPGRFDFTTLDALVAGARAEGYRLVLIWFGLWKNATSTYVPDWVKRDPATYRNADVGGATRIVPRFHDMYRPSVTPLCDAAVEADARAFAAVMARLRETDPDRTVVLVQVENEIGLLTAARDFSPEADRRFAEEVPGPLAAACGVSGTWKAAFGDDAEETFMAWHYGRAVERIASAGAKEYPLPMYVNAWLQQDPDRAGNYPSGGPVMKMRRVWRTAAPSIVLQAPDIYLSDFEAVCREYAQDGNPLFIPEVRYTLEPAAEAFAAVAEHGALGFCPFGIEGEAPAEDLAHLLGFPSARETDRARHLAETYRILGNLAPVLHAHRGTKALRGFYHYGQFSGTILPFTKYDVRIEYHPGPEGMPPPGGLVAELGPDEFLFAGRNFLAFLLPKKGEQALAFQSRIEEGQYVDGAWTPRRLLNGDEQIIAVGYEPKVLRVEAYKRPVR